MEEKPEPIKAYEIDLDRIEEGYLYDEFICYAHTHNEARYKLMHEVRNEDMKRRYYNEEVTYTNIPVKRLKSADKVMFEGKLITKRRKVELEIRNKRTESLNKILTDQNIQHCYIKKHGSYYMPNCCGYTSIKERAGVYEKSDAVSQALSCQDLVIVPINVNEHNAYLKQAIEELQSKILALFPLQI